MVSNVKRMRYVSDEFSSSEGESFEDVDHPQQTNRGATERRKSKGKWLSKNAIMARENRLKKKLYISNLEREVGALKTENINFTKIIENQSSLIADLRKEIKYLKSIIANSADIGNLIKNIHRNTGMSVTTSLDQTLSHYVSKPKETVARKTAHPWEETKYPSYPTPESDFTESPIAQNELGDINDLLNFELDEYMEENLLNSVNLEEAESNPLKEHNYTSADGDEDVGVCLHVSKHRVSLEFCSTCSDNASQAWDN